MAVSLSKGQKVDLTKTNHGLNQVIVGLGWDANLAGGPVYDLDASAFLLNQSSKVSSDADFVFYNNPAGGMGSIVYTGDNTSGIGGNDDEQILVELSKVPQHIQRIAFTITIHDGEQKGQTFGQVRNAYVRVCNKVTGEELIRYNLGQNFHIETAIVAAELYRYQGEWKFSATGSGFKGGLAALCSHFGIQVEQQPVSQPFVPAAPAAAPGYQRQGTVSQGFGNPSYNSGTRQPPFPPQNYGGPAYQQPSQYQAHPMQEDPYGQGFACLKCGSSNVRTGKKGFGLGKAAVGGLLLGPIGLLGGFVGGNKLKVTCNQCGYEHEPHSSELSNMANDLKYKAKQLISQNRTPEVMDAIVAGLALVATADGYLDPTEKQKIYEFVHLSEELRTFGSHQVNSRFDYFTNMILRDSYSGKAAALQAVGRVRSKQGIGPLIVRYGIALGYADGSFVQEEQQVIAEICRELGLNPRDFLS